MTALLRVEYLKKHYPVKKGLFHKKQWLKAVNRISFVLNPGKTLAIVGESGCGKSTLGRVVTGLEGATDGNIFLEGQDITAFNDKAMLRKTIQMVFQNPYGSLNPRKKIINILEEPLIINTHFDKKERFEKAQALIEKVGLHPQHLQRYPHMFSGGQRQRIAIARALMLNPKIVVADECVSALDVSIQAQILNLLIELQDEFKLSYLFISHDLSVVRHIAHDIMVMYLGRSVEQGEKYLIFDRPLHPYTQALLSSAPHTDPHQRRTRVILKGELPSPLNPPSGCVFRLRCPYAKERCAIEVPQLRMVEQRLVACHRVEEIN